ncbi:hypothetical protein [Pseudomonas sp. 9Ag]|jgi:hypothetical protein|uniref:hypothetical protein n=1 Tax=Pseudomonas sp. 9Ag TaxID=2653167 RepID=UPI0012F35890|nr:hypothetical protein [Pseudomonas sp. 9Ag]VXC73089.1 conserved hypothetical protein [Pseudomonas sp. 9Ag]
MKRLRLKGIVVAMIALLGACDRRVTEPKPAAHPHLASPQQRFFEGQALPGEFLTLEDLPAIPASFEEPQQ